MTVFAEKLSIPTSIAFHRGGVIVQNATQTMYLKDTDGDDRADERRVMFTGWNMRDTHGGVSNFQYGLDNWIWAMQGYNNSRPTTRLASQVPRLGPTGSDGSPGSGGIPGFARDFFASAPTARKIEFIALDQQQHLGTRIQRRRAHVRLDGQPQPERLHADRQPLLRKGSRLAASLVLRTIADTYPVQADHRSACGRSISTAATRPPPGIRCTRHGRIPRNIGTAWRLSPSRPGTSSARSCSTARGRFSLEKFLQPAGQRRRVDFADHGRGRARRQRVGHRLVQLHRPAQSDADRLSHRPYAAYETDLRDKKHGRVYRVVYDAAAEERVADFAGRRDRRKSSSTTLKHPNLLWRRHAQRLLVERGQNDVVPQLIELVRDGSVDAIGLNVGAMHALWTLHGLGALDGEGEATRRVAAALLRQRIARRAPKRGAGVASQCRSGAAAILAADLANDPDAQVRLAAYWRWPTAGPTPGIGEGSLEFLQDPICRPIAGCPTPSRAPPRTTPMISCGRWQRRSRHRPAATTLSDRRRRALRSRRTGRIRAERCSRRSATAEPQSADTIVRGIARGWPKDRPRDAR